MKLKIWLLSLSKIYNGYIITKNPRVYMGLPRWLRGKESACKGRRCWFSPCVGKIFCRRKWQPTPVFLPGKSHWQRSLADYSPRGHKSQTQLSNWTTATSCTKRVLRLSTTSSLPNCWKPKSKRTLKRRACLCLRLSSRAQLKIGFQTQLVKI